MPTESKRRAIPPTPPEKADVVVVGAGPVGLTLACLLADHGLEVVVLEAQDSCSDEPRAVSLVDESLRILDSIDVLDAIRSDVVWNTGSVYYGSSGQLLVVVSPAAERLGFPRKNCFDQPGLQRALLDAAGARTGVTVCFGTAFSDMVDEPAGVVVTTNSATGGEGRLRCRFLVGCDGGRSAVRARCGIEMAGSSQTEPWIVLDLVGDPHRERMSLFYCDPSRPTVVVPGTAGRCRYEFMLLPGETAEQVLETSFLQSLLKPFRPLDPGDIRRKAVYVAHQLVATRWRTGNVFLAGDAAHLMPPFAGQGLNSGLRDAWNLAWKLAAVAAGRATEELLDSYQEERAGHAQAMVDVSRRMGRLVMTTDRPRALIRDAVFRSSRAWPPLRRYFAEMRFVRQPQLDDGLVVRLPGSGGLLGSYLPQPFVVTSGGARVPLDRVLGRGWSLLHFGPSAPEPSATAPLDPLGARRLRVLPRSSIASPGGAFEEVSDAQGLLPGFSAERYLLVRPDRIVAADFAPEQVAAAVQGLTATVLVPRYRPPANVPEAGSYYERSPL